MAMSVGGDEGGTMSDMVSASSPPTLIAIAGTILLEVYQDH